MSNKLRFSLVRWLTGSNKEAKTKSENSMKIWGKQIEEIDLELIFGWLAHMVLEAY